MLRFALRRLLLSVPLVIGVMTLVFVLLESAPGDPADLILGDRPVPPDVRERLERTYGFDRPPLERYVGWMSSLVLRGDLGWSFSRSRPVGRLLAETLPPTLLLAGAALLLHLALGIVFGIVSAARAGRWPDRALNVVALTFYSMPLFWLALMAILALSYVCPLFPAASIRSIGSEEWPAWRRAVDVSWHLALPAIVLALSSAAGMSRFLRAGLLEALGREFVRAARARGVGGSRVMLVHALRNALGPVINLAGLSLPVVVSGSLIVETVFAWPGMGRLTYDAIMAKDLPVVMVTTVLAALMVVLGNLAADLGLAAADPRIRVDRTGLPG